jgi:hypothetical protein
VAEPPTSLARHSGRDEEAASSNGNRRTGSAGPHRICGSTFAACGFVAYWHVGGITVKLPGPRADQAGSVGNGPRECSPIHAARTSIAEVDP